MFLELWLSQMFHILTTMLMAVMMTFDDYSGGVLVQKAPIEATTIKMTLYILHFTFYILHLTTYE